MSYVVWPDGPRGDALCDVNKERWRQEDLKRDGEIPWSCADLVPDAEKLVVLAEEFGEVSREVCEGLSGKPTDVKALREELIQVAAVCVAWVEAIDKTGGAQ